MTVTSKQTEPRPRLTESEVAEIEARLKAVPSGKWSWEINLSAKQVSLVTNQGLGDIVMDFVRYGMGSAQPRFNVSGLMEKAETLAAIIPGREHHKDWFQRINHPVADFFECAPTDLRRLLNERRAMRPEVLEFAHLMEKKLRQYDAIRGDNWKNEPPEWLFSRLQDEVKELLHAVMTNNKHHMLIECVDVANFAMMITGVCGFLAARRTAGEEEGT